MITISVMNMRGGCGKTTLSTAMAATLPRTLLIDADMQCNASKAMRANCDTDKNLYSVLTGQCDIRSAIQHTSIGDCVSGSLNVSLLMDMDLDLLNEALKSISDVFEYVVIDSAPSFGALNLACLVASDFILVPVTVESFAVGGLLSFAEMFNHMRRQYGLTAKFAGIVVNKNNPRQRNNADLLNSLHQIANGLGIHVFQTVIRESVVVKHAQTHGETIFTFNPNAPIVNDFLGVISELEDIINGQKA